MAEAMIQPTGMGLVDARKAQLAALRAQVDSEWDGMTAAQQKALTKKVLDALLVVVGAEHGIVPPEE